MNLQTISDQLIRDEIVTNAIEEAENFGFDLNNQSHVEDLADQTVQHYERHGFYLDKDRYKALLHDALKASH